MSAKINETEKEMSEIQNIEDITHIENARKEFKELQIKLHSINKKYNETKNVEKIYPLTCSICRSDIEIKSYWKNGNNAEPVNSGRCCDKCNISVVLVARINMLNSSILFNKKEVEKNE